jgi:hypothetical protein
LYGPLEMKFLRNSGESGTYFSDSTGIGVAKGSARMLRKSLAGLRKLNSTVRSSTACTPLISFLSM